MIKHRVCKICHIDKEIDDFYKHPEGRDGYLLSCKKCIKQQKKDFYKSHQPQMKLRYKQEKESKPWVWIFKGIKQRCENPNNPSYKSYGEKGIQCLITKKDVKFLWFRDKAYLMEQPSIDRIDNDGNYCLENCQFLEQKDNFQKVVNKLKKKILQFDLNGNFIKEWESIAEASRQCKTHSSNLSLCCLGKIKSSQGFIWKYK
jgi:hypothetical protein